MMKLNDSTCRFAIFIWLVFTPFLSASIEEMYRGMDVNKDGEVTQVEFLSIWHTLNEQRDRDGDGRLNLEEYGAASFDRADFDKDGYVSFEEDAVLRKLHFEATDLNHDTVLSYNEFFKVHEAPSPTVQTTTKQTVKQNYDVENAALEALSALTDAPQLWLADGYSATDTMAAVYYDALDYQGQPTKVFAWLGLPDNSSGDKVPAVVLVHGGGGTAYKDWVLEWTKRGYAAIRIAVEGQTDVRNQKGSPHLPWEQHQWAGPHRSGIYHDSDQPFDDQWMTHAVANTILANSLLRSLPEVDADRVGVMGISWGGVIASTVIGLDPRFTFAIPVYGCGGLATAQNQYGETLANNELYQQVWDPLLRMDRVTTPTLWLSWPEDSHFPLDAQASCYQRQAGEHMVALVPKMGHGHGYAWMRPESYAFADSVLADGMWCRQIGARHEGGILFVDFETSVPLERAVLVWSSEAGATGSRVWTEQAASVGKLTADWTAWARIPDGATGYFLNVYVEDLVASSDYFSIDQ